MGIKIQAHQILTKVQGSPCTTLDPLPHITGPEVQVWLKLRMWWENVDTTAQVINVLVTASGYTTERDNSGVNCGVLVSASGYTTVG